MSEAWDKIQTLVNDAAKRLGLSPRHHRSISLGSHYEADASYSILRLRNRVHQQEIELADLRSEINNNKYAREHNPGLQDAWDQYQVMLKLVKGNIP